MNTTPDDIRLKTMETIERQERLYRWCFVGGAVMELLFFVLFFRLMNLHDKLHVLLFIATVSSYTIIVMGLLALGALSNRNAQRILRAIADPQNRTEL